MESLVPPANYSHHDTEWMLKKWNGRIAHCSHQLLETLTQVEQPIAGELLNVEYPPLDDKGNWIDTFVLNKTYTLGSLFKDSQSLPVPLYIEYANDIRFVPVIFINNHPENYLFTIRKVDLGETKPTIHHHCRFLYGGKDVKSKPQDFFAQHASALEYPYHIEKFAIQDYHWDRLIVIPLYYKDHFYMMLLPQDAEGNALANCFITEEHRLSFKEMIDNEYEERLLFQF